MEQTKRSFFDTRVLFAIAIIVLGVIALLDNLGYDINFSMWDWWPLIIVLIGLGQLLQPQGSRHFLSGAVFILIGALFLLNNFDVLQFHLGDLWPLIFILIGIAILRQGIWASKVQSVAPDYFDNTFILSGGTQNIVSRQFKGGKITAIMGGGKIDMRESDLGSDTVTIEATAIMGGIEFIVPKNWQVVLNVTPILGGADNRTVTESGTVGNKRLIIKGAAIMGGMEVKN